MTSPGATRYFAYGSNLSLARMRGRVPDAVALCVARLDGHRLTWDKRGADGSGKANLRPDPGAHVWGVVYRFGADGFAALDVHEPDYQRIAIEAHGDQGPTAAQTYLSQRLTDALPFASYKRLVVEGARAHGLPADWLRALEAGAAQPDR